MRARRASAENPPKTTLCVMPRRAQASSAMGNFRNHRHVDDGAITTRQAAILQHRCKAANKTVQFLIGDGALVARLTFKKERDLIFSRPGEMPVNTVEARIDFSSLKPFGKRRLPIEGGSEILKPSQLFAREFRPETGWILFSPIVKSTVFVHTLHMRVLRKLGGGRKNVDLTHERGMGSAR